MATAEAYERLVSVSRDAEVGRGQLENFLAAGYVPQPKQFLFHGACRRCDAPDGPVKVLFGGARGPGKSHATLGQVGADDCQRFPGLKWLHLRKVGKAAREGLVDLLPRVLGGIVYDYKPSLGTIFFPNGSRIIIGNFQNEKDIENYLGLEYDGITIEEATQLSRSKVQNIESCLRTSKVGWRPRMYLSTNPGGIGHLWVKSMFITKPADDVVFIPATVDDNRFVNIEYRATLERFTGWQLRAWRFGDWDIAAGQYFSTFRRDVHVIDPFPIPSDMRVWASLDYGFTHNQAMYLLGQDGDGVIYHIAEHVERKMLPQNHAEAFKAMLDRHDVTVDRLWVKVAGTDIFNAKEEGLTIADKYAAQGLEFTRANTDRINGAAEYLSRLGDVDRGIPARMKFFSTCARLIDCVPALQHDPHRPEDVLKVDADDDGEGGDDEYDASRYGVMATWNPAQRVLDHYALRATAQAQQTPAAALPAARCECQRQFGDNPMCPIHIQKAA